MLSASKRIERLQPCVRSVSDQIRYWKGENNPPRRRSKPRSFTLNKPEGKSEWWIVDGEMHEIGENVPPRERFVILEIIYRIGVGSSLGSSSCAGLVSLLRKRNMSHGAKGIWNCIKRFGRTGSGCTGMRDTQRSLLMIMQIMNQLRMMILIFHHTGAGNLQGWR
ncbi:unnamed protein product [Rhodiola kirilowii]